MSKFMKIILIIVVALVVFLVFSKNYAGKELVYKNILIGNKQIRVMIADNMLLRKNGLSNMENLTKDRGMLFVFKSPAKYSFWMKDMKFPIDIIWIDKNKKVIGFNKSVDKDFNKSLKPQSAVKYVLEVNSGFVEENNLNINDKLVFKDS